MKKPSTLKLNDNNKTKRSKGLPSNYELRKKNYQELKNLRQKLKDRKTEKVENVLLI